jgi:hypothetical protein
MKQVVLAILLMGCAMVAGCASVRGVAPVAEGSSAELTPEGRLAAALAAADAAAATSNETALVRALSDIEALGGWPEDSAGEAQLAVWRERSGTAPIPLRGRTLGRGFRSGTITPGSHMVIAQTFLSGQKASIAVSAVDGKPLGLSVLDSKDQPVCREQSPRASCSWVPLFTQRHTIQVRNLGPREVRYYLVID